jgi:hypothetical protein
MDQVSLQWIFIGVYAIYFRTKYTLVQALNELLQHVPVRVYQLQGEHNGSS